MGPCHDQPPLIALLEWDDDGGFATTRSMEDAGNCDPFYRIIWSAGVTAWFGGRGTAGSPFLRFFCDPGDNARMAATKKSPRKRNASTTARDVAVKVDARLKKLWDKTLAELREAQQQGAGSFDRLWEAAASVVGHDPPLYVLGGYASAAEFFEQVLHEEERAARRFIRVARYATPAEEDKYGTSVLDAALGYIEARIGKPLEGPLPVAFDRLKLEVSRDGKKTRLPLAQLTVAEIAAAARALRKPNEGAPPARVNTPPP